MEGAQRMASATDLAQAGLQGWRRKVADAVAGPVSSRTPAREEHVRALIGASFFALSVMYVVKTLRAVATRVNADR
jgi:hypothetical protein